MGVPSVCSQSPLGTSAFPRLAFNCHAETSPRVTSAFLYVLKLPARSKLNQMHKLLQILTFWLNLLLVWPALTLRSHLDHSGCLLCRLIDPLHHPATSPALGTSSSNHTFCSEAAVPFCCGLEIKDLPVPLSQYGTDFACVCMDGAVQRAGTRVSSS